MKKRLLAILAALALTASLTACQRENPAPEESNPPEELPASSQDAGDTEDSGELPPAQEDEASPLLTVEEYTVPSGAHCTALSGGRAMLWDSRMVDYLGHSGVGNMIELDLDTGETRELGIWADLGMVRTKGDTFYWVGMDEELRYPEAHFPDYIQAGIFKGDSSENGELIYKLDSWEDDYWKWQITELAMGSSFLLWAENWRFGDGGQAPNCHQRIQAMNLQTGEIAVVAEWDAYDRSFHQMRVNGDRLIWWESIRNEETRLHLYDLSAGEELLTFPVTGISDADFDEERIVWCQWIEGSPAFRVYDMASGESRTRDPGSAYEVKLLAGRYILYTTDHMIEARLPVRLYDLEAGEDVHGRIEDNRQNQKKARQINQQVFDETGGQTAYTTWYGDDELTLTVIRFLGE